MPASNALIFKLDLEVLKQHADEPQFGSLTSLTPRTDEEHELLYDLVAAVSDKTEDALRAAHLELIRRKFDPKATFNRDRYIVANTPEGRREFSTFSVGQFAMEDDESPAVGIAIADRYFPVWADWRDPHGTSGDFTFDAELLEMIEEARQAIAEVIPEVKTAAVQTKLCWY
jgi:hypothetical protein